MTAIARPKMRASRTRKGNVFSVHIDVRNRKYFQYIANDSSQLGSDVIRVFKKVYRIRARPDLYEVVSGKVEFYAHVVVPWGVKMGLWKKVGHVPVAEPIVAVFRDSRDYGNPKIKTSEKWEVWKINGERRYVGKLKGDLRRADLGPVINPKAIVYRMRKGKYDFLYPGIKR